MTQTLPLLGIALQWKAVGPFNQAPNATVSIRLHAPFEDSAKAVSVVFPATNVNSSSASFFATPLIGRFGLNGCLVGPDGYPLVVPPLDTMWNNWITTPVFYEIQIDIEGMSARRGIFVAFTNVVSNMGEGDSGVLLSDSNASISAMTGSGSTYTGTVYFSDTVVSPVLVNQSITVEGFTATVNSIDLATNSAAVTTTAAHSAEPNTTLYWGDSFAGTNLGVDLSSYVNWI